MVYQNIFMLEFYSAKLFVKIGQKATGLWSFLKIAELLTLHGNSYGY